MKHLNENEMVMISGGTINWDAWDDGYNCVKCRVMAGSVITWSFISGLLFSSGPIGAIASAITQSLAADKVDDAVQYCTACYHEVFE